MILTTLSTQINNTVFIDKTQKERKELLAQFMGIGIFDKLYVLASEKIKEVNAVLKSFRATDYDIELLDIKNNKRGVKDNLKKLEVELEDKVNSENELKNKILNLAKKFKGHKVKDIDIDELKGRREKLKEVVTDYDVQLANVDKDLKELEWDIDSHTSKIENYKSKNIETQYTELEQVEQDRTYIKIEIDKLKID